MTEFVKWEDIRPDPDPEVYADELAVMEMREMVYRLRKAAGFSQAQLAKKMGAKQSLIARLEGGGTRPTARTLARVAEACGATLTLTASGPGIPPLAAHLSAT